MYTAGIIAEFNPLHNGHKYLINTAKKDGYKVACVISGNFVQRGDTAIIPKFRRAEAALSAGADIVAELPVPWSMSTAQNFALGGISQLAALGVDTLYFGSESGDTELLLRVADIILSEKFNLQLGERTGSGATFAKLRSDLLCEELGHDTDVLKSPNDTLAVEYICAAKKLSVNMNFKAVKRKGSPHDAVAATDIYPSSTYLRRNILFSNFDDIEYLMPKSAHNILLRSPISNINRLDTAIIYSLRMMTPEELLTVPDVGEGLENLITKEARTSQTFEELCAAVKSKRYTLARIRRIILSAFLKIDKSYFGKEPPYVRILGFTENGINCLNSSAVKPIVTKVSQLDMNDPFTAKVFELENRANDIYALSLNEPSIFTDERKEKILIKYDV